MKVHDNETIKLKVIGNNSLTMDVGTEIPAFTEYEGPYNVVPSNEAQTLLTDNTALTENVTVEAIPGDYVGENVPRKSSSDLLANGAVVSVPAGYYTENANKSVSPGSAKTHGETITVNPLLNVDNDGVITATVNRTLTLTPDVVPGYVENGQSGEIVLSGNSEQQLFTRSSDDLVVSGQRVIAPPGYYPDEATKKVPYTWQGENTEFLSNFATLSYTLKNDTTYSSWTPSTTAGSIKATGNHGTFVADMSKYEYIIEWLWYVQMVYPDGQTYKACVDRTFGAFYHVVMRRPYGLDNFAAGNWTYNYCTQDYAGSQYIIYWNTSGTKSWTGTSYGVYCTAQASSLSSTGSNAPTVTLKRPQIYAKCNASYFSTTRAGEVNQEKTTIKMIGNLYRVDINTTDMHNQWARAINLYNNPL